MLTRLRIKGFKNFLDAEFHFGPFTCIAGWNGVGKSNLFDAIGFLNMLAEKSLLEAAVSVRDSEGKNNDPRSLFIHSTSQTTDEMSFDADLIVPKEGQDDLGQRAVASYTFLNYRLTIAYWPQQEGDERGSLQIVSESLSYIPKSQAAKRLLFPHSVKEWRDSVITGRRSSPFISTEGDVVKLHQDNKNKKGGRTKEFARVSLPRTVLSTANASESPTALLARREMQSWQVLQLEPNKLRAPDGFYAPTKMGSDGSHLPATLYRLAQGTVGNGGVRDADRVYADIANSLTPLINDAVQVQVDRDIKRELYTLKAAGRDNQFYAARALSDGTLRFIALAVMKSDPLSVGLVCMEEPENGIHPQRIDSIVELLQEIAIDVYDRVDEENPLRQVIVNTHSPIVARCVPEDTLLFLENHQAEVEEQRVSTVRVYGLSGTWRVTKANQPAMSQGRVLQYLAPVLSDPQPSDTGAKRVIDRNDVREQLCLDFRNQKSIDDR